MWLSQWQWSNPEKYGWVDHSSPLETDSPIQNTTKPCVYPVRYIYIFIYIWYIWYVQCITLNSFPLALKLGNWAIESHVNGSFCSNLACAAESLSLLKLQFHAHLKKKTYLEPNFIHRNRWTTMSYKKTCQGQCYTCYIWITVLGTFSCASRPKCCPWNIRRDLDIVMQGWF